MLTALIVLMLGVSTIRAEEPEPVGWVASLEGTVEVIRSDVTAALAAGETLQLGDRVRTSDTGRVKLLFRDDSVLTLNESSELVVDEQTVGPVPVSGFSLFRGKVRAIVTERYGAAGSSFEVRTPTAIAGVRGTEFVAAYDLAKEETVILGVDDVTVVRARLADAAGRWVAVGPGESTRIPRGGYPTAPVRLPEAQIRSFAGTKITGAKGSGAAEGGSPADPRQPRRPGDRDGSPEGRVVDQPLNVLKQRPGAVLPPPPPVP